MIISINAGKAFDKIQHPLIIKAPRTLQIKGTHLNQLKTTCNKPKAFLLKPRVKGSIFSLHSYSL
jgi:hypothetical protein